MSQIIKSQVPNDNYRQGWERIFDKNGWTIGRSLLAIRAIQVAAEISGKPCCEVAQSEDWQAYLYSVN